MSENLRFYKMMRKLQKRRDTVVMTPEHIHSLFLTRVMEMSQKTIAM